MKTIEQLLEVSAASAFSETFPEADIRPEDMHVTQTTDDRFGDYQCNSAMPLAKRLKKSPRQIAEAVVARIETPDFLSRIEIAGPGFINFYLEDTWLARRVEELGRDDRLGIPSIGRDQCVVIDYSGPNIAKPMHIGHIRSTVIGNALDRLHRWVGYRVIADNHLGDWGTQYGLIIMGYRHLLNEEQLEASPIEELERIYVESTSRAKEDPEWMDQARQELVKLQQGDEANLTLWKKFVELSMHEFDRIYDRLGVRFDLVRGESYYREELAGVVEALRAKGLIGESEGALVANLEAEHLGVCIVRKSDGGFNYATSDLATVYSRNREFAPEKIIYVTDERQQLHFKQFFHLSQRMGWQADLVHVWFGLMRLPEGTFSTRDGNVIKLEQLLDEAENRALTIVQESSPDMPAEQQTEVARAVGKGAIKYADLSQNPQSLVTFSWDKAMALDGNSAPYLQYACARISSVLNKYKEQHPGERLEDFPVILAEAVERRIAVKLAQFPETVLKATALYRPNIICDYLFELSQLYSSFYQNVPFLKAEAGVRESRLRLCSLVAKTLKQGLELLGIETPARI